MQQIQARTARYSSTQKARRARVVPEPEPDLGRPDPWTTLKNSETISECASVDYKFILEPFFSGNWDRKLYMFFFVCMDVDCTQEQYHLPPFCLPIFQRNITRLKTVCSKTNKGFAFLRQWDEKLHHSCV